MFERRLQVLLVFLAVFCVCLALRAVALQGFEHASWVGAVKNSEGITEKLTTTRGRILDVKGRELAIDQPCIDACVDYRAITLVPDDAWVRSIARARVKLRVDNYLDIPLADRKKLLDAEMTRVKADITAMWRDLASLSHQSNDDVDDIRRQIIRRVETQRRLSWYHKYQSAATTQPTERRWYDWLVGNSDLSIDQFDVHVADESQSQLVLPHIDYALRNELNRNIDHYPGLELREGVRRFYPYGSVACQTIGRLAPVMPEDIVNDPMADDKLAKYDPSDRIGREGMEKLFEPELRGLRGLHVENEDGPAVPDVPPQPGHDVRTSIDIELQQQIEQAFTNVAFMVNPKSPLEHFNMPGAAVVIDLPTNQVRALVSWPTYNLNQFDTLFPTLMKDVINRPMMNRATMMAAQPGSTVKPMVGIAAITSGVFRPDETVRCNGFLVLNGHQQTWGRCWTEEMYGLTHMTLNYPPPSPDLTFPEALQRSCNVFHETLAYRMGLTRLCEWFRKFGLGEKTGIGLLESSGLLPDSDPVPAGAVVTRTCLSGIGEDHVMATPIQMANVAATIARGGLWMKPTLFTDRPSQSIDLQLNLQAVAEAHQGMKDVVNTPAGSGYFARLDNLIFSGKTGSAQTSAFTIARRNDQNKVLRDAHGKALFDIIPLGHYGAPDPIAPWYRAIGDHDEKVPAHGWMIGYAPSDHPKIAFAVLVEYGGGGGLAAGSVVKPLLDACIKDGYLSADDAK